MVLAGTHDHISVVRMRSMKTRVASIVTLRKCSLLRLGVMRV